MLRLYDTMLRLHGLWCAGRGTDRVFFANRGFLNVVKSNCFRYTLFQSGSPQQKQVAIAVSKTTPHQHFTPLDWVFCLTFLKSIWMGRYMQQLPAFMRLCVAKLDSGQAPDMVSILICEHVATSDIQQILESRIGFDSESFVIWLK